MKVQVEGFKFFVDGESKTVEETKSLIHDNMTITISGLDVHYFSPKKENRVEKILKQVEQYQNENEGILEGVEFPYNDVYGSTETAINPFGKKSTEVLNQKLDDILNIEEKYWDSYENVIKRLKDSSSSKKGIKENQGKLHYELSWEFIEEMAKRMANNKSDKYPLYNWKKSINVQDLKDAINRHHIEVMKGNYQDEDEVLGHIVSYSCNAMMLWEQLRIK